MIPSRSSSILLFVLSYFLASAHEVPTKKAMPPKMDPPPTLPEITHKVWMDIEINGENVGRIQFGLFGNNSPKVVENFVALAKCDHGTGKESGKPLCYKGTSFHRVIPNFGMQGGDVTHNNGIGGESIYGGKFPADNVHEVVKFSRRNVIAVASSHEDQMGSQFMITTVKAQWLTGKHTIFGTLLWGGQDVLTKIEEYGTYGGKPKAEIKIANCGVDDVVEEDKKIINW